MNSSNFSARVLRWGKKHGRHNLPWQTGDPYLVWLSEVMLQQTQVSTVIPRFLSFVKKFPTLSVLADAESDEVLHQWAGLGYYARCHNLHRTAKLVVARHNGKLPSTLEELIGLPGIGRSTAGAILAAGFDKPGVILDGNVKRVLARYFAVEGWPGKSAIAEQLWQLATDNTPQSNNAAYNQAMMDLGATLCTRHHPDCNNCPLKNGCKAGQAGLWMDFPGKAPKRKLPRRSTYILVLLGKENGQPQILMEKRPPTGIWAGLWSLPEVAEKSELPQLLEQFGLAPLSQQTTELETIKHSFTHYHLSLIPLLINTRQQRLKILENDNLLWYNPIQTQNLGFPAPIAEFLSKFLEEQANKQ